MVSPARSYSSRLYSSVKGSTQPDKFSQGKIPGKFIISKNRNGEVLSVYDDDVWDFSPYAPSAYIGSLKIYFFDSTRRHKSTVKKILFTILYFSDQSLKKNTLKPSTLLSYASSLKYTCRYADQHDIDLITVLTDKKHFIKFLREPHARGNMNRLMSILSHLSKSDLSILGNVGFGKWQLDLCRAKLLQTKASRQTPVIPERVLSNLIYQIEAIISDFLEHSDDIYKFLRKLEKDKNYGRTSNFQYKNGIPFDERRPVFASAVKDFGLSKYFEKNDVKHTKHLIGFVNKLQQSVKILICIYSGMRIGEISTLETGCLVKDNKTGIFEIHGYSSKGTYSSSKVSWVTSPEVVSAISLAEKLASIILKKKPSNKSSFPLFPSAHLFSFGSLSRRGKAHSVVGVNGFNRLWKSLNPEGIRIVQGDLDFLEMIDPFRDWASEDKFKIGSTWHFNTMQFRRSLAFYVAQSGLVSFSALKRQLKHVTRAMTLYYCQSHSANRYDNAYFNEFHEFIFKEKPEADTAAYIKNVLNSDEQLLGVRGKSIESERAKHGKFWVLKTGRSKLKADFKKRKLSYSETPLGACTTISKCNKMPALSISGCLNCSSAVIKRHLIESAINHLENHVEALEVNSTDNFAFRLESRELTELHEFRDQFKLEKAR